MVTEEKLAKKLNTASRESLFLPCSGVFQAFAFRTLTGAVRTNQTGESPAS